MGYGKAIGWIALSGCLFAAIGAGIGFLLGSMMPGYYRSVFSGSDQPDFDPVAVGFGQGLTQGLAMGATVGLVLVLASWWKEYRLAALTIQAQTQNPNYGRNVSQDEPVSQIHLGN